LCSAFVVEKKKRKIVLGPPPPPTTPFGFVFSLSQVSVRDCCCPNSLSQSPTTKIFLSVLF
jgi:hypothetical protein